jgi:hypothetical protein
MNCFVMLPWYHYFFPFRVSEVAVLPASPNEGWLEVSDEEAVSRPVDAAPFKEWPAPGAAHRRLPLKGSQFPSP